MSATPNVVWMDPLQFLLLLYGLIALGCAAIGVAACWALWWFKLTSKDVREFRKAVKKGRPLNIQVDDAGQAEFLEIRKVAPTGYGKTSNRWLGIFPRAQIQEDEWSGLDKDVQVKLEAWMNELATKKATLKHSKIPIWFSYSGKSIFASLYSLLGVEVLTKTTLDPGKAETMMNGGETIQVKDKMVNLFKPITMTVIKALFGKNWDESELQGLESDSEMTGIKLGQKFKGDAGKMFFWAGLAMLIVGAALAAIGLFLK